MAGRVLHGVIYPVVLNAQVVFVTIPKWVRAFFMQHTEPNAAPST